ncbi:MAG: DUF2461 domain-containing protein [Bacteroidales bacterium]|nr:DUF2461 domain-containing protein [Bacteroidales bacterium]
MKQVLRFLHSLSLHNDKAWFDAHKADYLKAKNKVDELAVKLIEGIRSFDDTVGPLTAADCTYRIYRDIRFSKDKSPYKTHMGVFVNRGGKKSDYGGYYFHIDGTGDFRQILAGLAPGLVLDTEGALKKVPKGFPADSPDAAFFKLKNFCLLKSLDQDFILSPNLVDSLLDIFRTGKPFLDYINRAIDYCREERQEKR